MPLSKKSLLLLHVVSWLLFISLPLLFIIVGLGRGNFFSLESIFYCAIFLAAYMALFYSHTYILADLFFQKKYRVYFLLLLALLAGIFFLKPFDTLNHSGRRSLPRFENTRISQSPVNNPEKPDSFPGPGPSIDIVSIFLFIVVIAVSFALLMAKRWKEAVEKAAQAEADKANAELSFLKAQINPHFLFNTLNNIYSLAVTKNNETPNAIMKLSNIMRYVTDDVHEEFVPMQSEVDCMENYVELQRLRLGKKVTLHFETSGNFEAKKIAPLILMTFVENVFKHGLSNHEESMIHIKLAAADNHTTLTTQNKVFNSSEKENRTGIGISNTKKRLKHLYSGMFLLNITNENSLFAVELILFDQQDKV